MNNGLIVLLQWACCGLKLWFGSEKLHMVRKHPQQGQIEGQTEGKNER